MTQLKQLIENYQPMNQQEEKDKENILKMMDTYQDVLTRENTVAHFSSSAFVVNKEKTKTLMIYHNIYNSWAWTGGHADGDDNLFEVAKRELEEEAGISHFEPLTQDIFTLDILTVNGHVKKGKYVSSHVHLNTTYVFVADEHQALTHKPDENSGVKWIDLDKLEQECSEPHMMPVYNKIIEKIKSIF